MKTTPISRRGQMGYSMVEMVIAVALVSSLLVGVLLGVPKLQMNARLEKARQEIPLTIVAMSAAFATKPDTSAASVSNLIKFDVWPKYRIRTTKGAKPEDADTVTIDGVFPGSSEVVVPNAKGKVWTEEKIVLVYWIHNIPAEACVPLVRLLASQGNVIQIAGVAASKAKLNGATGNDLKMLSLANGGKLTLDFSKVANCDQDKGKNMSLQAIVGRL
jgi:type II secretory pathway pseudopilin PulG